MASVASFFVSRVDTKIDKELDELGTPRGAAPPARQGRRSRTPSSPTRPIGEIFGGDEFADLRAAGARVQRCLWASTSTKNPDYRDVLYVEELIGPETVDTMPLETITAFLDHGELERTLDSDVEARTAGDPASRGQGISHGARHRTSSSPRASPRFSKSFDELIGTIESKREELAPA